MTQTAPPPPPTFRVQLAVGLLAAATLGIQIGLTRLFSFLYWHHFAFMIIGIGMLGFGAAGARLAYTGGIVDGPSAHTRAARAATAAALAVVLYLYCGPLVNFAPLRLLEEPEQFLQLSGLYLLILIPFTALGLAQGSIIAGYRAHAHRVYGADLLGAGLGCLVTLNLLEASSASTTLLAWGGCAAVAGGLLGADARGLWRMLPWGAAAGVLVLGGLGWAQQRPFVPAPSKDISGWYRTEEGKLRPDKPIAYTVSSATIRLDVSRPLMAPFSFGGEVAWPAETRIVPTMGVYQDGAAPTNLFYVKEPKDTPFLGATNQGLAYQIRENPTVCIIGAGGGADVMIALHHGAQSIIAVELNPQMLALGREIYRNFVGSLFHRPQVTPVVAEGRHFLGRTEDHFDIIQMSGVDTFAALASGAYAMSENYLYTVEAGQAVLQALTPDGLFTNSRWVLEPPRETLRLAHVLSEALRRNGVANPADHLFVIRGEYWGTTLMSRRPFTAQELDTLRAWTADRNWVVAFDPNGSGDEPYVRLLLGTPEERGAFAAEYPFNVTSITDNDPFFFQFYKWRGLLNPPESAKGYTITHLPVGYAVLLASLLQMLVLSALFILGPLWAQRSRLRGQPHLVRRFMFFAVLGIGFMGIEITSLQAFTVFLGAPIYSMAITLAALLVSTGVGALTAGRLSTPPTRLVGTAVVGITLWVVLTVLLLRPLLQIALPWSLVARGCLVAAWLFPVGVALGVPFPTALRALEAETPAFAPWAWGTNACASVLASLGVVLVSMQVGFRVTLLLAAGLYWVGYLAWRSTVAPGGEPEQTVATAAGDG